jgi:hypothetical protein
MIAGRLEPLASASREAYANIAAAVRRVPVPAPVRQQWEKIPEPWRQRWWILALLLVVFSEFRRWRVAWYTMLVSLVVEAYRFVKRSQIEPPESFGWNLGAPGDTPLPPEEWEKVWYEQEAATAAFKAAQADQKAAYMAYVEKEKAKYGEDFEEGQLEQDMLEEENRVLEEWEVEEQRAFEAEMKKAEQDRIAADEEYWRKMEEDDENYEYKKKEGDEDRI